MTEIYFANKKNTFSTYSEYIFTDKLLFIPIEIALIFL